MHNDGLRLRGASQEGGSLQWLGLAKSCHVMPLYRGSPILGEFEDESATMEVQYSAQRLWE